MSTLYVVFTRCPWQRNDRYPQGWEPMGGAPKTFVADGLTFEEAREMCTEGNADNVSGVHGQTYHEFMTEDDYDGERP
jgi:hypothetical protein